MKFRVKEKEVDTSSICKLQNYIRAWNAYKQVEEKTNLNVPELSESNLQTLKHRLSQGKFLPNHIKDLIQKEKKKPDDILTPSELDLYSLLLSMPIYLNHASPEFEKIEQSGTIHSKASLQANGISVRTHTPDYHGQQNYVFFSYGLRPTSPLVVNFLCDNNAFIVNLDELQKKEPIITSGSWSSGHFYAYDEEQTASPAIYQYNNNYTIVQTQYWINKRPLVNYYRKLTFTYPDHSKATLQLDRSQEISAGKDIKGWHALKLIEFVRFLHPEIRKYILKNYTNTQLIMDLYDSIFTPGKAEFHFPYQYKHGWTLEKRDKTKLSESQMAFNALYQNDIESLKKYVISPTAQFYQYEFNRKQKLSLLNLAVLLKNEDAIDLLIKARFDPNVEYIETRQSSYCFYACRTSLQDAVECGDESQIKLLLSQPKTSEQLSITYTAYATFVTIQAAIATRQHESILRLLLLHFPNLDSNMEELLILACYYNNIPAIKVLLENGADINKSCTLRQRIDNAHLLNQNIQGTPLTVAAQFGHEEIVVYLLRHKADCNQPARHSNSKYLNGYSPLMAAIKGLAEKEDKLENFTNQILSRYYSKNKVHAHVPYLNIIDNLIKTGANLNYCDDYNMSVMSCIQDCLKKEKYSALNKLLKKIQQTTPNPSPATKKPTKSAAIITSKNENNEWMIVLGNRKNYHDKVCFDIPGGTVDYEIENNLRESITNITGMQTNLNLQEASYCSEKTYLLSGLRQIFHFHFNSPIAPFKNSDILCAYRDIKPFTNISWVKICDLQLKTIEHEGTIFPIFYMDEVPLPLYACPSIAVLYGIKTPNIEKMIEMTEFFSMNAKRLASDAIHLGQLDELKKYLTLGVFQHDFQIYTDFLRAAFQSRQYHIVSWLLEKDLYIHTPFLLKAIFEKGTYYPVDIILELIKKYPDIMTSYGNEKALAKYAGKYCHIPLIEKISPHFLNILIISAVENKQFGTLLHLQNHIGKNKFLDVGIHALKSWLFKRESTAVSKIISSMDFIYYFLEFYNSETHKSRCVLSHEIFFALIRDERTDQEFDLMIDKLAKLFIKLTNEENEETLSPSFYYNVLNKLNQHTNFNRHKHILKSITANIPVLALYYLQDQKKYAEMDEILIKYKDHPALQSHLKERVTFYGKDENGNTVLHRAVKANRLSVVKLLATNKKINLNVIDKQGRTPLYNAVRLGFHDMANFLRDHGAEVRKKYSLKTSMEKHAVLISRETYLQPFSRKGSKQDLYSLPVERISHGIHHAICTSIFTKIVIHIYQAMGHPDALKLTNEDIVILQIVALCHDAMRENDMEDKWEDKSAQYCVQYLLHIGISPEKATFFANAIISREDNLPGRILQSADCLEIPRVARVFYINQLAVFQDATPEYRSILFELVKQVIQLQARQYNLKHDVEVRLYNEVLFSAKATRCPEKPELKQFYEQHAEPYSNIIDELEDFKLLKAYFNSADTPKPKPLPDCELKWSDAALSSHKKIPLIIGTEKWFFYCYDNELKAKKDLAFFKENSGELFPDLIHHGRIVEYKKFKETPFRIRLSIEQHQHIQSLNAKQDLQMSNPNLLFNNPTVLNQAIDNKTTPRFSL